MNTSEKLATSEKRITELEQENKRLHDTVAYLTKQLFGKRSEKTSSLSKEQVSLFDELPPVFDEAEMEAVVDDMLEDPVAKPAVEAFKAGNEKVIGFLIGQVMQKSGGRANPSKVQEIIRRKIFASDDAK